MKMMSRSKAAKGISTVFIEAILSMVKGKVMELSPGTMENSFRATGTMERKMDLGFGNLLKVMHMKDNG